MNLVVILGLVIAWGASVSGAYFYGTNVGADGEIAGQAKINQAIADTKEQAQLGASLEIAKIKIVNTTVRQRAETVVRDNVRYVDCRHADGMLDTLNEALTGSAKPASAGKLPATHPVK